VFAAGSSKKALNDQLAGCPKYDAVGGAAFVPITPDRLLDTRPTAKPGAGASVNLVVAGQKGVPADAVAVALNVTMVDATAPGFVQVFPTGKGTAGSSSNLNADTAGQTIPNAVIAPIGDNGSVTIYTEKGTHLLVDVSGYFANPSGPVTAGRYSPITPERVLDSRPLPKPAAGSITSVDITKIGVPAARISAVALNVTATDATAPGFVQLAPGGQLVPFKSSNLNVTRAGQTIPNMVIVPVKDGKVDIYTEKGTHLLVDVLGWFTSATEPAATTGLFVPMTPERVLDSRPSDAINFDAEILDGNDRGKPAPKETVTVKFLGLPKDHVGAVVTNITATAATAAGFVQAAAEGQLSAGKSSNLNVEKAGQTIPNAAIVPTGVDNGIALYTDNGTHLITDISGFFTK
jgi:hypothetical protein